MVAKWPDLYSNLVSAEISHRNFASIRAKKWNFCNCKKKLCFTQRNLDRAGGESASFESMVLCAKAFYSLASSLTSLSTQHIADAIITGFTLVEGDRRTACCYHLSSLHLLFFPLESSSFKSSGSTCVTTLILLQMIGTFPVFSPYFSYLVPVLVISLWYNFSFCYRERVSEGGPGCSLTYKHFNTRIGFGLVRIIGSFPPAEA